MSNGLDSAILSIIKHQNINKVLSVESAFNLNSSVVTNYIISQLKIITNKLNNGQSVSDPELVYVAYLVALVNSNTPTPYPVTAASNKIDLTGSNLVAALAPFQIDVVPANIPINDLDGILNYLKGGTGLDGSTGAIGQSIRINSGATGYEFYTPNSGSVTSVGLSLPSIFTVTNSPVTSAGNLTGTLNTQTANTVFAGATSGGAATPTFRALVAADLPTNTTVRSFGIVIDGGGNPIVSGIAGDVIIPYNCTITSWTIVADQVGSIVIDLWKDTYSNYPPTVADTITGSEKPTLSSANKNQDTNLTTWTTSVIAGDIIRFNIDSASTVTRVTLSIQATL